MLIVTNPAFYKFVWHEGSPYVEIFRPGDPEYAPFEAKREQAAPKSGLSAASAN